MKKMNRKFVVLVLIACFILSLTGCGNGKKKYAGTYMGQRGSTLILNKDGSCVYSEDSFDKANVGTWDVEKNKIAVSEIEDLGYDIYAQIPDDGASLLLQADSGRWNDELFIKTN